MNPDREQADKLYTREQIVRKLKRLRKGSLANANLAMDILGKEAKTSAYFIAQAAAFNEALAAFPPKGSK